MTPTPALTLRPFAPADAEAFRSLNEEWISRLFTLEEEDRRILGDPATHILAPGGAIFMAEADGAVVGCCALIPIGEAAYEVAKMSIAPEFRGRGLGRRLLEHTIEGARRLGARLLHLETSTNLQNAIHLYEAVGFRHLPPERVTPSPYARANVFMELELG